MKIEGQELLYEKEMSRVPDFSAFAKVYALARALSLPDPASEPCCFGFGIMYLLGRESKDQYQQGEVAQNCREEVGAEPSLGSYFMLTPVRSSVPRWVC
jgi:hypothetical protein